MKWTAVRSAWEAVIEDHLQPADMLAKGFDIEVRSDNGPQFLATRLREFFAENLFKLTVPRYLINSSLKLEAELRSKDPKKEKQLPQSAPQANAGKQQKLTPAVC